MKLIYLLSAIYSCILLLPQFAVAASSVSIWPIDPVLEEQDKSSAIWLENHHTEPVYLQIRVLSWQQANNQDIYQEQKDVIVSPPFTLIEPGKRQLIRLVKNHQVVAGKENAYRILVDEVPRMSQKQRVSDKAKMGIDFKMRYSVPLFSSAKGIWTKQDHSNPRDMKTAASPILSYQVLQNKGQRWLEIKNVGNVHARISKLNVISSGRTVKITEGLLGYVLPAATMRWQIPAGITINKNSRLEAMINGYEKPVVIKANN